MAPTKEPTPSQTNAPKPSATLTPAPTKGPTETPTPPLGKRPQIQLSLPASELQPEKVLLFAVDKSFIEFEPGERPIKDVKVFNKTDQQVVLYSKVEAVTSPGTAEEAFAPSDKLLVSPKRLPIEALGSAAIRLVALEDAGARPDEGEYTYRISLFPQEGAPKTVEAKVNEAPHKINVVAGLAITAVLPAADAAADISFSFSKEEVIFSNSGSRTAALENCAKCPMTSAECSSLPRRLVAPKSSISLPISGRGIITCDVRTGADFKKINAQYGAMEVK